jgi:hypothetical protein
VLEVVVVPAGVDCAGDRAVEISRLEINETLLAGTLKASDSDEALPPGTTADSVEDPTTPLVDEITGTGDISTVEAFGKDAGCEVPALEDPGPFG